MNATVNSENIARKISELIPGSKTILFGSYARGDQTADSDFDLCVLVPEMTGRHMDMRLMIRAAVRDEINLPLDVLVYTYEEFEHSAGFRSRLPYSIKREGVVLNA